MTFPHNGAVHFQATSLDTSICTCNGIGLAPQTPYMGYPPAPAAPAMPPPPGMAPAAGAETTRDNLIESPRALYGTGRTPLSRGKTPSLFREREILKILKKRCTSKLLQPVIKRLANGHRVPDIPKELWKNFEYCVFESLVGNSYQSVVHAWAQTHFAVREMKALISVQERWSWGSVCPDKNEVLTPHSWKMSREYSCPLAARSLEQILGSS